MNKMLLTFAEHQGVEVKVKPFRSSADGLMKRNQNGFVIGLNEKLRDDPQKADYILAHELAHIYLHSDKGNTIVCLRHAEYEEQADRVAALILDLMAHMKITAPGGNPEAVTNPE